MVSVNDNQKKRKTESKRALDLIGLNSYKMPIQDSATSSRPN